VSTSTGAEEAVGRRTRRVSTSRGLHLDRELDDEVWKRAKEDMMMMR
jgi:hypothetical protein